MADLDQEQLEQPAAPVAKVPSSEYELEDSEFDPELHSIPQPKRKTPPKGPDGKFISQKSSTREPAAEPQPVEPQASQKYTHSRLVTRKALEEGYDQHFIDSTDPAALEAIVDALDRRHADDRRINQNQVPRTSAQQTPAPTQEPAKADSLDELSSKIKASFDDDAAAIFNEMIGEIRARDKKIADLEGKFAPIESHVRETQNERLVSEVDKGFADLGERFEVAFGKGAGKDMQQTDPLYLTRLAVINSLRSNPIPGKSVRQAVAQRAEEMYGRLIPAEATKPEVNGEHRAERVAKWNGSATPKPTDRNGSPEPKGEARATKAVAQILHERFGGEAPEETDLPD